MHRRYYSNSKVYRNFEKVGHPFIHNFQCVMDVASFVVTLAVLASLPVDRAHASGGGGGSAAGSSLGSRAERMALLDKFHYDGARKPPVVASINSSPSAAAPMQPAQSIGQDALETVPRSRIAIAKQRRALREVHRKGEYGTKNSSTGRKEKKKKKNKKKNKNNRPKPKLTFQHTHYVVKSGNGTKVIMFRWRWGCWWCSYACRDVNRQPNSPHPLILSVPLISSLRTLFHVLTFVRSTLSLLRSCICSPTCRTFYVHCTTARQARVFGI